MISCGNQHIYVVNHELEQLIQELQARQTELHRQQQQVAKVQVLLVDDSPALRAGMRLLLEETGKFCIAAETGTVTEALELIEITTPDIVIASFSLPDAKRIVSSQKNAEQGSHISVIFLGPADIDIYLVEAWKAEAIGFISKQMDRKQLVQTIEMASSGQPIWSEAQLKRIEKWQKNFGRYIEKLSFQEEIVFNLLAARMTNKEIAKKMSLSEKTVEHYVSQVLGKLGAVSRTQVAQWVEAATPTLPWANVWHQFW